MIRWSKVTREDYETIEAIVLRAMPIARKMGVARRDLTMDLAAVHANACRLRLEELLGAPELDFWHDVLGIYHHLDRKTGMLTECFVPRFAKLELVSDGETTESLPAA